LFEVFAAHEMMGLQDVRNAAIAAFDHPVGLRRAGARLGLTGFFALWALFVRLAKFRQRLLVG
jgi:hypothetical protein